jgi:hypothetical protein
MESLYCITRENLQGGRIPRPIHAESTHPHAPHVHLRSLQFPTRVGTRNKSTGLPTLTTRAEKVDARALPFRRFMPFLGA